MSEKVLIQKLLIVVLILLIGNCTYILKDLTLENDFVLEKSLVFKSENEYIILSENLVLVYTSEANGGELKKLEIVFENDTGVLLRVNDKVMNNKTYTTNIIWKLEK